ncbi:MAG: TolC family protein [Prevotellaceae bacterium]|nr:TolC family protein [Prevotellaceae bacterium]
MAQYSLDDCKRLAYDNYPVVRQFGLIEQSRDYTVSNASKAWLPQISATGGAYFFTDVVDLGTQASSLIGDMKNEIYNIGVQINQTIYDGGSVSAQKRTAKAEADVSLEQTNVAMYELNSRIEQLYFGILTIDEQLNQSSLLMHDLSLSMNTVSGMMKGGLANQSDVDAISVEQIKVRQKEESLKASRKAYLLMLSTFIGKPLDDCATLAKPEGQNIYNVENRRPELAYYAAKDKLLDERRDALDSRLMPRLSAFGMGMYHNKLLGLMKNSLLAGGFTLSWNIGALYTRKNDLRNIEVERSMNSVQREAFLFNTDLKTKSSNGVIASLQRQIALDDEIISLRESIRKKSETKVLNGTETVNEMLRNVNAVSEARQTKALHELQLLQETYNLKNINNN